jgi:membrane-bound lytic murein transglycosylase D
MTTSPSPVRLRAVVLSLLASGCAGGAAVYTGPAGPIELQPHTIDPGVIYETRLDPVRISPPEVPLDEILASPVFGDPDFDEAVREWVDYWQNDAAEAVPVFLGRMVSFEQTIDSALAEKSLPASLRYLPFIESGYNTAAASRASAVGMWQFMAPTAQGMGMEVSRLLDERRDPIRSTEAAVDFLAELHASFGSWFLALAAYNSGPNRVRRVLRQYAPDVEPSDSLFWELRSRFPRETRDFVPKLIGAILVAGQPAAYGYEPIESTPRFLYDPVTVPDATTLDVVARAATVSLDEIEWLNPQFVRGMTPPGRPSGLRVPEGTGATFERNYAEIPAEERVTFVEHRVEAGETLSHIAVRYGVLVADLNAANPGLRPRYLRIGSLLTVPVAPSIRGAASSGG